MNKQEIVNDLHKHCGSFFITRNELAKFMGKKTHMESTSCYTDWNVSSTVIT